MIPTINVIIVTKFTLTLERIKLLVHGFALPSKFENATSIPNP